MQDNIDEKISINNRRADRFQRMADKFSQRVAKIKQDNQILSEQKAQVKEIIQ